MKDQLLDITSFLKLVLDALEASKVEYLIGGAVAEWAWGEPRATQDLDIVIDLPIKAVSGFSKELEKRNMLVPADQTEPAASHANSMAVVRRVCRSCFNSGGHLHRTAGAVQRGFGDRSLVFFVVIGTVRLAALNCRIFVLKWAKQIGQQLESIEAQKVCDVENVQVQVVSIESTGMFVGANIRNLSPVV